MEAYSALDRLIELCRTHRRRTQNYVQELEKEVLRLRAREMELLEELKTHATANQRGFDISTSPSDSAYSNYSDQNTPNSDLTKIDLLGISKIQLEASYMTTPTSEQQMRFSNHRHGNEFPWFPSVRLEDQEVIPIAECMFSPKPNECSRMLIVNI